MSQFKGIIAAGSVETAQAGAKILEMGGNAIDAMVAAVFASFVAESLLVNISGGGIATVYLAQTKQAMVYDFFSDMPHGVYNKETSDFKRILVDFGVAQQPFYIGRASVAVPGVVAGLCTLLEDHGTFPLPTLLESAITLAKQGVALTHVFGYISEILSDIFMDTPESAALHLCNGQIAKTGDKLYNHALAQTLTTLGKQSKDYYYQGELAEKIIADQQQYGGLLTFKDLQNYQVYKLAPILINYKQFTILAPPPSSVGGVLIAFSLHLLASIDFSNITINSSERISILAEVMRLTNIARKDLQLDSAGVKKFLSETHIKKYQQLLKNILNGAIPPPEPSFQEGAGDTSHISVMDGMGNVVSLTTSAGESAGFVVADTGVTMNNMLGEIDLHPDGFHKSPPGERLQTMMSPMIVLKNNEPVLVLGSGGSNRLRSAMVQVLSNMFDFSLSLTEAINLPRCHFHRGVLELEGGIPEHIGLELTQKGYKINCWPDKNMYFGGVHSVAKIANNWMAVGDARRCGHGIIVK